MKIRLGTPGSQRYGWLLLAILLAAGCPAEKPAPARPSVTQPKPVKQGPTRLTFVPGSTEKMEQLIGDRDRHLGRFTHNKTRSRYGIIGADLGASFEHKGKLVVLFGDTIGPGGGDAIAYSDTLDPSDGFLLTFPRDRSGGYLKVKPEGELMRGFEVPVGGVSVAGVPYIFCKRGWTRGAHTDRTSLVRFNEEGLTFSTVREVSRLPGGRFIKISPRLSPAGLKGLPGSGQHVLLFGTGPYRQSRAYLAAVRAEDLTAPGKTFYFAGLGPDGQPRWSGDEGAADPLVKDATLGDISVTYSGQLKLWLMTHDSRATRGIIFRYAPAPWGPWSAGEVIFNARRDGLGRFIHRKESDDGLARPVIGKKNRANAEAVQGGAYAPYMVERFTTVSDGRLIIHYLMSTWNPYVVVLMRSQFRVE